MNSQHVCGIGNTGALGVKAIMGCCESVKARGAVRAQLPLASQFITVVIVVQGCDTCVWEEWAGAREN